MNPRGMVALIGVPVLLAALAGCSGDTTYPGNLEVTSTPTATAQADGAVTLGTARSDLGEILVDGDGRVIYAFDSDTRDGESACVDACLELWPPVLTEGAPSAEGLDVEVGTIARAEGQQVTVNGLPVYYYANDTQPGDASGQGAEGDWWVLLSDGQKRTGSSDY